MTTDTLTAPPVLPPPGLPVIAAGDDASPTHFRVVGTEHDETYDDFLIATEEDARKAFRWVHPSDPIQSITPLIREARA